jgi:hypothetical protein
MKCDRPPAREATEAQRRHAKAGNASGGGKHQALGEQLAHQPRAAGAERRPDADFALPCGGAREQEIGDIDARDEQHQQHGADQHEQRRPNLADHQLLQRKDHHGTGGIALRLFFLQLGVDPAHLAVGLIERDAVAQPPDRVGRAAARAARICCGVML